METPELYWQNESKLHITELNILDELAGHHTYIGKILENTNSETKEIEYLSEYTTYKDKDIVSNRQYTFNDFDSAKQWVEKNISLQFEKDHQYDNVKDYNYELNQENKTYQYLCYIDSPYKHSTYPCLDSKKWIDENNIEIDKSMYNLITKFAEKERKIKEELEAGFGKYGRDKDNNEQER